jgi:hypothetical protein
MDKFKKFIKDHKEAVIVGMLVSVAVVVSSKYTKKSYAVESLWMSNSDPWNAGDIIDVKLKNGKVWRFVYAEDKIVR